MVLNQMDNRTLKQDLIDECRLNVAYDNVPSTVIPSIQPIVVVEKKYCDISKFGTAADSLSTVIYTTPTDRDFYLCSCCVSLSKDVNSLSTASFIDVTIQGVSGIRVCQIRTTSALAQTLGLTQTFNPPLKIDRGTSILIANLNATATITASADIQGYTSLTIAQELR